jgi:ribulose 1,5-bisphosphate carboxylase large subunit-like protein
MAAVRRLERGGRVSRHPHGAPAAAARHRRAILEAMVPDESSQGKG